VNELLRGDQMKHFPNRKKWTVALTIVMASFSFMGMTQEVHAQRSVRAYIPPDQLVSMLPTTSFETFTNYVSPIFERVTGKTLVDPESRKHPIGISISGVHFLDALEMVLQYNNLQYRETERYFMIEPKPADNLILSAEAATGTVRGVEAGETVTLATIDTRQIEINAVLFELNHTLAKDTGIDWSVIFGSTGSTSGAGGAGGSGEGSENQLSFSLKTSKLFEGTEDFLVSPGQLDFANLNSLFRMAEAAGVGETIASPSVTVQSGIKGDIQIGSDVPVQIRDNFGNIATQLFKTGIIIDVTPTLIVEAVADTIGSPVLEFVHLTVKVEKSGSRPSASGPIIDRSNANTQVLLLNGEQTVIGGLYSTEESISRRGVPFLKDLPKWFFGLRYIFGRTQRLTTQKELVIALQATVVDPIRTRAGNQLPTDMLQQKRDAVQRALNVFNAEVAAKTKKPAEYQGSKK